MITQKVAFDSYGNVRMHFILLSIVRIQPTKYTGSRNSAIRVRVGSMYVVYGQPLN